jgi:hypothetical protein
MTKMKILANEYPIPKHFAIRDLHPALLVHTSSHCVVRAKLFTVPVDSFLLVTEGTLCGGLLSLLLFSFRSLWSSLPLNRQSRRQLRPRCRHCFP